MSTRRERADRRHRFDDLRASRATRAREPGVYVGRPTGFTHIQLVANLLANMTAPDPDLAARQADALAAAGLVTMVVAAS